MGRVEGGWDWGQQDTVIAALERAVTAVPDKMLLDFGGDRYTYAEIDHLSNRLGHSLTALGVTPRQTVVTMLDNNVDAVVAWLSINKIGAVSVPLNTALRGEFLRHQITDAGAAIVICEAEYLERIVGIADKLPDVTLLLHRGETDLPDSPIVVEPFDHHRGTDESPIDFVVQPTDLAALIYTSGTTGPSKGCMVSSGYMCNLARLKLDGAPAAADDISFTPLPLFHMNACVSGILTTILVHGGIAFAPRFSVSNFWPEIERSGATIASILGSMATLLANADDNDSMKNCFGQVHTVRGNPFPVELKQIWQKRFGAVTCGGNDYGLTEAAVVTSLKPGEAAHAAPNSSGRRNECFDVRIVDDDDRELPPGEPGEIIIRPLMPNVMFDGYWRRPEATLDVMGNMWFHSGDIGKFDDEGYFYFVDRKKDYLRRRGENISSFEIETTFSLHPDIEDVAVHAVLSDVGEDDVKVTAVLRQGATITEEELCRWSLDEVPYYAVPRYIEFRSELPKNPQGRVLKYQLRDDGCTPTTWDREDSGIDVKRR